MKYIELDRKARELQKKYKSIQIINKSGFIKPSVSFRNNKDELKLYKQFLFIQGFKRELFKKGGD